MITPKSLSKLVTLLFLGLFFTAIFATANLKAKTGNKITVTKTPSANKIIGKAYIIDGDSIKIGKKEIRLIGIDAPEYKQKCFNAQKQKYRCGIKSKKFLISLTKNQKVTCFYDQKDIYNRFLSECFSQNNSLNKKLIENGMAIIYNKASASQEIKNLELEAKDKKLGIWQGAFQIPQEYRKANRRKRKYNN